ncbi:MAG: hypothetical protein KH943_06175, partial [Haemophilus parahaemolyticus]|uniref:hypothetical protein n=1 Tax=Haemophilus parahaemolyticus TaxID=735 RepID=UPI0026F0DEFE
PFTLLHLTVEPEFIDVNVHPSKMELRFKDVNFRYILQSEAWIFQFTYPTNSLIFISTRNF